ncbi:calcium-binding protein [Tabrizicola sp. J26]|uniref:calcium-binding protein n=1 Tax=Alitabrizicola rongguiensis TaxID=2909234 RepID=UPI001F35E5A6|nr:calcium-binding protein [Tabrizicola rongguiensis]MCF1707835.1 calcium-binding protein [Tabrizicola rongguiensis]
MFLALAGMIGVVFAGVVADAAFSMLESPNQEDDETPTGDSAPATATASDDEQGNLLDWHETHDDDENTAEEDTVSVVETATPVEFDDGDTDRADAAAPMDEPVEAEPATVDADPDAAAEAVERPAPDASGPEVIAAEGGDPDPASPALTGPGIDEGADGNDLIHGSAGDDLIASGGGDDHVEAENGNDIVHGNGGDDLILGGNGDDALHGGAGDDSLAGGDGADTLAGHEGDDRLIGGSGDDSLIGGDGDDWMIGGRGDDALAGGDGNDSLSGDAGTDILDGNGGDDLLDGHGDHAGDFLNGGEGDDTLVLGDGDVATGGEGHDDFHLEDWETQAGLARIEDFDPLTDQIVVFYDPSAHPDPELSFGPTHDGTGTVVKLDGLPVAELPGVTDLDEDAVRLECDPPLAA